MIRVTTLPNGLRVATDPMEGVETVSLGVWVGVGTRNEDASVNGVAHLVEHMLFKGTPTRSAFDISQQIEAVGGNMNAYTTRENTAYFVKVLKEDAGLGLDIIADMVQHASLDEEELGRERGVVLQEIGQAEDTPDDIIFDYFQAAAYPDQPLGRPVLGEPDIIETLPRHALADYIGRHYRGPALVVAAAGRIDHDWLVERVAKVFADLPGAPPIVIPQAHYRGGEHREDRDLEQLHLVLGFDSVSYHHDDYYPVSVMSTLLGGGMSSRLFQEVRERRGLAYSVYSFCNPYVDGGVFGVYAGTGPDQVGELVPVICDELAKVADHVDDEEIARSRAQLRASTLMALESTMARCEQLGQQMLIFNRPIPTEEILADIARVDGDAVRRVASTLWRSPLTLTALGPLAGLESLERIAARLP